MVTLVKTVSILAHTECIQNQLNSILITWCNTVERLQEKVCIVQEEAPSQSSKQENPQPPRSIQVLSEWHQPA